MSVLAKNHLIQYKPLINELVIRDLKVKVEEAS